MDPDISAFCLHDKEQIINLIATRLDDPGPGAFRNAQNFFIVMLRTPDGPIVSLYSRS